MFNLSDSLLVHSSLFLFMFPECSVNVGVEIRGCQRVKHPDIKNESC